MSGFEFLTFMGGLLVVSRVMRRLERRLRAHRASYASAPLKYVDDEGNDVTEFLDVMFANFSVEELADLSVEFERAKRV